MTHLLWHDYRYYPYERDLARREVLSVLGLEGIEETEQGFRLPADVDREKADRLTYFARIQTDDKATETVQAKLEEAARNGRTRQATRYSVHGLHEYKGKFNPQVAKAVLNIFGVGPGTKVLDPFCGSGTTLVECAHLGALGVGTDLNPLAVFVANAKLRCLSIPASTLLGDLARLEKQFKRIAATRLASARTARDHYLRAWFEDEQLVRIENVRKAVLSACPHRAEVFLALASNLLRDYSEQDPNDLRIRRRSSPLPDTPFQEALLAACKKFIDRLEATQRVLGLRNVTGQALLGDVRDLGGELVDGPFDAAITSPPYATALPYIDTQRLSLVWLGLCEPEGIGPLEGLLIGSREMKKRQQQALANQLQENATHLPNPQLAFCRELAAAVGPADGFRRQAVPVLLYRYFSEMRDGFRSVARQIRAGAPYALIVGHNHTVLSGIRRDIDTPKHLAELATSVGWHVSEVIPLQTYPRYGYHAVNAVEAETLLVLKNGRGAAGP
ncbi:MAG: RNA methylase [Alphaproteobacteria bacterium]|nr:RNA methylase [Alphaproteobacteria bacterium]